VGGHPLLHRVGFKTPREHLRIWGKKQDLITDKRKLVNADVLTGTHPPTNILDHQSDDHICMKLKMVMPKVF
jgi:hypothetical protein